MDIVLSFTQLSMAVIALMIGISVIYTSEKNAKHNWYFFLLCCSSFLWNFSYAAMGLIKDDSSAYFMRSLMFVGLFGVVNMATYLTCIWLNTNQRMKKIVTSYAAIGSLVSFPIIISKECVYFIHTPYGTYYKFYDYLGRYLYNAFLGIFGLLIVGIVLYRSIRCYNRREKFMAKTILICIVLLCIGILPDTLLPMFDAPVFPLSSFMQFFCIILVYIVTIRYNVTRVTIRNVSEYVYTVVEVPVVVTGEKGIIEIVNASATEFFSIPTDQLIGTDIKSIFLIASEICDIYEERGRKGVTIEARCLLNGARCSLCVSHIYDRYQEPLGDIIVITDLTAKLELIDQLNQSKKEAVLATEAKSAFLANMSHEIRTPMNAIIGMSEIMLKREVPPELKEGLLTIKNASEGLLAIINDILDFSKIESGKFEVINSEYDLGSLIADVVHMISVRLMDRSLHLLVDIQKEIPQKLIGDDIRIKQILMNILGNAAKFTKEGYIRLKLAIDEIRDNEITIHMSVSDTGIGIKQEDLGKLFGMFHQVDTRKNRSISGTGLGLSISKSLIEMMGGQIRVDSSYGEGTTFSWTIQQKKQSELPIYVSTSGADWNIVLYEEEPILAEYMMNTLQQFDINSERWKSESEIHTVSSGTYCIIRKKYLMRLQHSIENSGFNENIIVVLEVGSKQSSFLRKHQHIDLSLFGLQLMDIMNHRKDIKLAEKNSFNHNQVIPIPYASVLIVDDNITNLQVAEGLLAPYRMHVDTCMSGFDALQMVQSKRYHMIFMDHMMPDMDGTETMKRIRGLGLSHLSKLPVIALSANAMGNAREYFLKEGFQDYLAKPIEFYQLNHILKKYLRDAQFEQQDTTAASKETNQEPMKDCIDGIDMNTAIQALGGNYTAYYMILTTYYEDIGTRRRELPHILERKEYDLFTIYVHAIKSASKSVGAEEISRMALELEMYGKQKQYEDIEAKIDSFYQQLDQMINNLNYYFDDKITEQKEKKEWIGVLNDDMREELQKAAVDMDYAALEHIIKNLKNYSFDTKTSIMLESIQEALWDFDYARLESIAMKL